MHDYEPQHNVSTCLAFRAGQVIHVLNRDTSGWWDGELEGKRGWFPSNYVNADVNPLVEADVDEDAGITVSPTCPILDFIPYFFFFRIPTPNHKPQAVPIPRPTLVYPTMVGKCL